MVTIPDPVLRCCRACDDDDADDCGWRPRCDATMAGDLIAAAAAVAAALMAGGDAY